MPLLIQKPVIFDTPEGTTAIDPQFVMAFREVTLRKTDASKSINEQPEVKKAVIVWLRYSVSITVFGTLEEVYKKLYP